MTCTPIPGGFVCSRGPRPRCSEVGCTAPVVALCDFALKNGKSCDRRLCRRHAVRQPGLGADGSAERDYCPAHDRCARAQLNLPLAKEPG